MDKIGVDQALSVLQDPEATLGEIQRVGRFLIAKKKEVGRIYWSKWRKDHLPGISVKTVASFVSTIKTERVYRYSCRIINPEDAVRYEQQLRIKHYHYNALISIERNRRNQYRKASADHLGGDLLNLKQEREKSRDILRIRKDEVNNFKISMRKKGVTPEIKRARLEARNMVTELTKRIRVFEKEASKKDGPFADAVNSLNADRDALIKQERADYSRNMGLYWPNYLESEESARKSSSSVTDPEFKQWGSGEGHASIQVQGGLSVRDLFQCRDSRIQMNETPEPDTAHISKKGKKYLIRGRNRCRYRLESFANGSPFFIDLDVNLHRPLPKEAIIKWVHLRRRKAPYELGKSVKSLTKSYDYFLDFVVEEPAIPCTTVAKPLGVHLGWQQHGSEMVIMTTFDGTQEKKYVLGRDWLDGWDKAESLQRNIDNLANEVSKSVRTQNYNAYDKAKAEIEQTDGIKVAGQLSQCQARVEQEDADTKRRRNVIKTMIKMYRNAPTVQLRDWRSRHLHLSRYLYGMTRSLRARRDDIYHCWIKELQDRGYICAVSDIDLSKIATEEGTHQEVRRRRQIVSLSRLRNWMGAKLSIQVVDLKDKRRICHVCGSALKEWLGKKSQTCDNCESVVTNSGNQSVHLYRSIARPDR